MKARRDAPLDEHAFALSGQGDPRHATVVEPQALLRVRALIVEFSLIVDEDIPLLHLVEAPSDPDVAASAAYILELEIVLMTMNGRRGQGLLAVVEAHIDKAHALPREMRLEDILILLVVNDTHFSHLLSRILIFIYILP